MIHTVKRPPLLSYFFGLDLGRQVDFSAMAIIERTEVHPDQRKRSDEPHFTLVRLFQWPLDTPYPKVVRDVAAILDRPERATGQQKFHGATLGIEKNGVGNAIIDLFQEARLPAKIVPVLVTSGQAVAQRPDGLHLAKGQLISAMVAIFQSGRLTLPPDVPLVNVLKNQLAGFQEKLTERGNVTYEAVSEKLHDDLVIALSLAVYLGEQFVRPFPPRTSASFGVKSGMRMGSPIAGPSALWHGSPLNK